MQIVYAASMCHNLNEAIAQAYAAGSEIEKIILTPAEMRKLERELNWLRIHADDPCRGITRFSGILIEEGKPIT